MDPLRFRLRLYLILMVIVMILATGGFMVTEGLVLVDALYFSIVTITTVGYGDIHPISPAGKMLAILIIITGVGAFLGVVANATEMILNKREKLIRVKKLNVIIGVFFSELGTRLLITLTKADPQIETIRETLCLEENFSDKDFLSLVDRITNYVFGIEIDKVNLEELRDLLAGKTDILLRLLENPNLLEYETFTELLQAVFHITEELLVRDDLKNLPETDLAHLAGDIRRSYRLLGHQWLEYMKHLKDNYPYLFSLAIRMNPFDREASPIVR